MPTLTVEPFRIRSVKPTRLTTMAERVAAGSTHAVALSGLLARHRSGIAILVVLARTGSGQGAPGYACPVAVLSKAELAAMAEEATVDAYGEDEQATGFHTMIVDNLKVPFTTSVLGVDVTVEHVDLAEDGTVLAICASGGIRQAIRVVDLPLPAPPPAGAEWIEAYRYWLG